MSFWASIKNGFKNFSDLHNNVSKNPIDREIEDAVKRYQQLREMGTPSKVVKLTANLNREMQENIDYIKTVGAAVECDFDDEHEKYIATCIGGIIGYFPKTADLMLSEEECVAFVHQLDKNDKGKWIVQVEVFIVDEDDFD